MSSPTRLPADYEVRGDEADLELFWECRDCGVITRCDTRPTQACDCGAEDFVNVLDKLIDLAESRELF